MLKITNLNKSYQKKQVLDNLNLEIRTGQVYGLLGPNGAGKTTTINIICNLLQADSGVITIDNKAVSNATKSLIGVAPQENLLYSHLTCAENLNFYAQIYGLSRQERLIAIENSLANVNLLDRKNSVVETLSGGMQRRMNIAIALIHHPKLLILDEPTTGLDIETRYEIWKLIENLRASGMTILLTTHLLDEAQSLSQCIGILKGGKIIAEGDLAELRKVIPAQEIIYLETDDQEKAIALGKRAGFTPKNYGGKLPFWLPEHLELTEIISKFADLNLNSISRQSIQLEHIYLEITALRF
jgi:ABC-2 type transport system ATP-binding protein